MQRAVDNPEMRKHCLSIEGELIAGTLFMCGEFSIERCWEGESVLIFAEF